MGIIIEKIGVSNVRDVNACDSEFTIDARLVLHVEDDEIHYRVVKTANVTKQYQNDDIDPITYVDNPDKTIFFAGVNGQLAGQIVLRKNWNHFAYVEDIVVDTKFRRQGIGEKLISQAKQWAREHNLAGIMLETQNNNVGACKFYERCGFQLGGFDKYLYKGINPETDEIALYWYLLFEGTPLKSA